MTPEIAHFAVTTGVSIALGFICIKWWHDQKTRWAELEQKMKVEADDSLAAKWHGPNTLDQALDKTLSHHGEVFKKMKAMKDAKHKESVLLRMEQNRTEQPRPTSPVVPPIYNEPNGRRFRGDEDGEEGAQVESEGTTAAADLVGHEGKEDGQDRAHAGLAHPEHGSLPGEAHEIHGPIPDSDAAGVGPAQHPVYPSKLSRIGTLTFYDYGPSLPYGGY